jgi:hypothetical protein
LYSSVREPAGVGDFASATTANSTIARALAALEAEEAGVSLAQFQKHDASASVETQTTTRCFVSLFMFPLGATGDSDPVYAHRHAASAGRLRDMLSELTR